MEAKGFRKKEKKELVKMLADIRGELAEFRSSRALGSLPDGSQMRKKRQDIARIKTVLKEKEIIGEVASKEEKKE